MPKNFTWLVIVLLAGSFTVTSFAQKRTKLGKVCGDPNIRCRGSEEFQPHELRFEIPDKSIISDSESFYAVILKSIKLKPDTDCENIIKEDERLEVQKLFPQNKVFALKCSEAGDIYYTNVANDTSFMAVYAGKTLAEAQRFLKTVYGTNKFTKLTLRRMHASINGT